MTTSTSHASFERVFGHMPGADRVLIPWDAMRDYFRDLAAMRNTLKVQELGPGTDGAPLDLLVVGSPDVVANIQRATDRRTPEAVINRQSDKPVVLITAAIHATEVGGVQVMPEFIEHMTSDAPDMVLLRERITVLVVPTLNPDGMNMVEDWYRQTLGGPYEGSAPPWPYHRYAGHDNNRDWYQLALAETRLVVERVHNVWHPHVVLDLHQMGKTSPRYVIPPFIEPSEPHVHPLITRLSAEIGTAIATRHMRDDRTGTSSGVMFDCYSPTRAYMHYHGGVRILAEAASADIASPATVSPRDVKPSRGFNPNVAGVHNPVPWNGGTWRLRDIMDYHLSTIWAVLEWASDHAGHLLDDQAQMLADANDGPEQGFLIAAPAHQDDPAAAVALVRLLQEGDINVSVVDVGAERGAVYVPTNQPFGSYAEALLSLTPYPTPSGANGQMPVPYDITSHCLPLHMGVRVGRTLTAPESTRPLQQADLQPFPKPRGSDVRKDRVLAIDHRSYASPGLVATLLESGAWISRLQRPHFAEGRLLETGTYVVTNDFVFAAESLASERHIRTWRVPPFDGHFAELTTPRIGVHLPWKGNAMDAGWLQLVLGNLGIPFETLRDADIRSSRDSALRTIVLSHLDPRDLIEGSKPSDVPDEYAGGLGDGGIANLRAWVEGGGRLVAIDGAAQAMIDKLALPVTLPLRDLPTSAWSAPGSLVCVQPDKTSARRFGWSDPFAAIKIGPVAFHSTDEHVQTLARFDRTTPTISGWTRGDPLLTELDAVVECRLGKGSIFLYAIRPTFRAQLYASYRLLLDVLLASGYPETTT